MSIESAEAEVCTTPGEGGGGGGGGTAVGGHPGGPGQITAHWSTQDVIFEPERTPLSKHWLVVMKPDSSEHAYSGCRIFV